MRCTSCFAPVDPAYGAVQRCPYCGATLMVGTSAAAVQRPVGNAIMLLHHGGNIIGVIKVVREHTGLGLKEAKELVERAPTKVAEWDDAARMQKFRQALIEAGAQIG